MEKFTNFLKAYSLFGLQILLAWGFTVPQVVRSFKSTTGMTITWYLFCSVFVIINIFLAIGAYKKLKNLKSRQIIAIYANWLVLWLTLLVILCIRGTWLWKDSVVSVLIIASVTVLLLVRRKESLVATISEPITRGIVSLLFKSVPQLFLGYCIMSAGSRRGLVWSTLLIGHITVFIRIAEIIIAARSKKGGWNKENIGLMISEAGNEISWMFTTVVWLAN